MFGRKSSKKAKFWWVFSILLVAGMVLFIRSRMMKHSYVYYENSSINVVDFRVKIANGNKTVVKISSYSPPGILTTAHPSLTNVFLVLDEPLRSGVKQKISSAYYQSFFNGRSASVDPFFAQNIIVNPVEMNKTKGFFEIKGTLKLRYWIESGKYVEDEYKKGMLGDKEVMWRTVTRSISPGGTNTFQKRNIE